MINSFNIIKSIFLLLLAIFGNFVAETLGCKTQQLLSNNMFIKQFIILLMIYFTLSFIEDVKTHPLNNMKYSISIWILFLMFTKMHLVMTIISFILLLINYVIHTFIEYYSQDYLQNKNIINNLTKFYNLINIINILIIIIGFIKYYDKQYIERKNDNFNLSKFIFGIKKCSR